MTRNTRRPLIINYVLLMIGNYAREDDDSTIKMQARIWKLNYCNNSFADIPSTQWADGIDVWKRRGLLHREHDRPAIIRSDGVMEYYLNGGLG